MLLVYASVCFRYFSLIPIFLLINLHLSIYYPNIAEQKKQNMIPIDEKHIIKKLKAGDNEAYKYIYDYHYVALCKLSYYLLKDRVQAESIVNDVIFHLWEVRDKLEVVEVIFCEYTKIKKNSKLK